MTNKPLKVLSAALIAILPALTHAAAVAPPALGAVQEALSDIGAVSYSHKSEYSKTIPDLYLGYDLNQVPVGGVAVRRIKTYEEVTALVVVRKKENAFIIKQVLIPDLKVIDQQEKRDKVQKAVGTFTGVTIRDQNGKEQKVDAVSGATRYQKRLYTYFNLMSGKVVEEILNQPDWRRQPLPERPDADAAQH